LPLITPTEAEFDRTFRCKFACCRDGNNSHSIFDDDELLESFLNLPPLQVMEYPLTMHNLQAHQTQDANLMQKAANPATMPNFPIKVIDGRNIICHRDDPTENPGIWKIALPTSLVDRIIHWYHLILGHRGKTSLYETIRRRFFFAGLKTRAEAYKCGICQRNKALNRQYGHLPERQASLVPWEAVAIDLIGPWKLTVAGQEITFNALTCIDPVTNLVELVRIEDKTASNIARQFENLWLSRYPKPVRCIHDNGGEFIGREFQLKLAQHGIHDAPTTSRNPTANAICERMHLVIGNILRTRFNNDSAPHITTANQAVDDALATCTHAMRCSVSMSLQNNTPGELVFHRDMILNLPVIIDLLAIQNHRQALIDVNLRRQNAKRLQYHYKVGGEVLIKTVYPTKMDPKNYGPFLITQVYTNGTVEIQRTPHVTERINIRRLVPFRRV